MNDPIDFANLMTVSHAENENILGQIVFYSLSDILVDYAEFERIRAACHIGGGRCARLSKINAFRSATGDLKGRVEGGGSVFKVYCRDNRLAKHTVSRELVLEELGSTTNTYTKLANIQFDKRSEELRFETESGSSLVDVDSYFEKTRELYALYGRCVNRSQIETAAQHILEDMEAIKIQAHVCMYFVPRKHIEKVELFKDFIEAIRTIARKEHASGDGRVNVNALWVLNDEEQRRKMSEEFYDHIRRTAAMYQERITHLIDTGSESPAVMNRWIAKIDMLKRQRSEFEALFQQRQSEVEDEMQMLAGYSQELAARSRSLALGYCA